MKQNGTMQSRNFWEKSEGKIRAWIRKGTVQVRMKANLPGTSMMIAALIIQAAKSFGIATDTMLSFVEAAIYDDDVKLEEDMKR